jgi:hypothetical protein
MAIFRLSTPDDPMYREGPQSYSPHWVRPFRPVAKQPDEQQPDETPRSDDANARRDPGDDASPR